MVLPLTSLALGVVTRMGASVVRGTWYGLVMCTWLLLVPLCTAGIWRLYLGRTPASHLFLSSGWIVKELMLGMSLTGLTLLLYMCMVCTHQHQQASADVTRVRACSHHYH